MQQHTAGAKVVSGCKDLALVLRFFAAITRLGSSVAAFLADCCCPDEYAISISGERKHALNMTHSRVSIERVAFPP